MSTGTVGKTGGTVAGIGGERTFSVLPFHGERLGIGFPPRVIHRRTIVAQTILREFSDFAGQLLRRLDRLSFRHNPRREPNSQGLIRVNRAPGEDEIHRDTKTNDPRQPKGSAIDKRHSPPSAEDPHRRSLLNHPQIAPHCELQTARNRIAANRRDNRLLQSQSAWTHRTITIGLEPISVTTGK